MSELKRIRNAYSKRWINPVSFISPEDLFFIQERQRELLKLLKELEVKDLSGRLILDAGCGNGINLREFVMFGASPKNLCGIDILAPTIYRATQKSPDIDFLCGNIADLPFPASHFDMVISFTVFTSILDNEIRENSAKEILRVLKPGGIIILHDFFWNNPFNPDVRGLKKSEIATLFSGCEIQIKKFALLPQITRRISPHSFLLCYLLEKIPLLRSHYLVSVKKNK